jgi:class 3 adenylate cyclase
MLGERRIVAIPFADVTGSTELGASLDPEDVRALRSRLR